MTLQAFLDRWVARDSARSDIAATIAVVAEASVRLAALVAEGPLSAEAAAFVAETSDGPIAPDAHAAEFFGDLLGLAPVAAFVCKDTVDPIRLRQDAPIAVAISPLDEPENFASNTSLATIFGLLPVLEDECDLVATFVQPGTCQLAAGFVLYGPHTALVLTVRTGVAIFSLDPCRGVYRLVQDSVSFSSERRGPGTNYTAPPRAGSAAAEFFRILLRGGVYLPSENAVADGWTCRSHLLCEANPLALLAEEAGGVATVGSTRILERLPTHPHERVSLILGPRADVTRALGHDPSSSRQDANPPLFGRRGLFRAG